MQSIQILRGLHMYSPLLVVSGSVAFGIEGEAHSLLQHTEPIHQPGNFTPTKAVYMHSPPSMQFCILTRQVGSEFR